MRSAMIHPRRRVAPPPRRSWPCSRVAAVAHNHRANPRRVQARSSAAGAAPGGGTKPYPDVAIAFLPPAITALGLAPRRGHRDGQSKYGRFILMRHTIAKRMRAKLVEIKEALNRMRHLPVPEQGRWLGQVMRG